MERPPRKPQIVCTPGTCGGKPRVSGTRIRVQDIVIWHERQGQSPEEIVAGFPQLTLADVYCAMAYYFDHLDEIKREMKESEEFAERLRADIGPGPLEKKLGSPDGNRAPLSP